MPIGAQQVRKISRALDVRPLFLLPGSARGVLDAEEPTEPSHSYELPEPCVGGAAGERVREIPRASAVRGSGRRWSI